MKIITNHKKLDRNSKIGFWTAMASPFVMAVGAIILFQNPDQFLSSLILLVIGFITYQIGVALRKYGRETDQHFNKVLKKLGKDYTIYHYSTPATHLLVGPAGIWILHPKFCAGTITYNERSRRWKQKRPTALTRIFFFMTESIGRPGAEIISEANSLERFLKKRWPQEEKPHIEAAVICMHQEAVVNVQNSPVPTLHINDLREFIRQQERQTRTPQTITKTFNSLFEPQPDNESK